MFLVVLTQKVDEEDAILGFFCRWLEGLARRVDRLGVIALERGRFRLPENTEVASLGREAGAGRFAMLAAFQKGLHRFMKHGPPDAVLAHMVPRYVLYALPQAAFHHVPLYLWYTHKGVDRYLRMAHPFVRRVFTASEESFRLPSRKKTVTGHGIDLGHFHPGGAGTPRRGIVSAGRIAPSKDPLTLVEAVARLKDRFPAERIETRIAGEPLLGSDRAYRDALSARVEALGLEEVVRFTGPLAHRAMPAFFRSAEILVNASRTGSVDKVVLEAMACGTPPLTCNEAFEPLFGDLAERLCFRRGDAADLAAKAASLLELPPAERAALTARLRGMVEADHDLERLLDRLVAEMGPPGDP